MSQNHLNSFPIEKLTLNVIRIPILMFGNRSKFHNFFLGVLKPFLKLQSRYLDYFKTQFGNSHNYQLQQTCFVENISAAAADDDDERICRQEVEIVMKKLGISRNSEGEKLQDRLDSDYFSRIFEEEEPEFGEMKEAFDVFDENRDGFIDTKELQRILCALGFNEGSHLGNCRKMISAFDDNGDGMIDFNEFVKLMENNCL